VRLIVLVAWLARSPLVLRRRILDFAKPVRRRHAAIHQEIAAGDERAPVIA